MGFRAGKSESGPEFPLDSNARLVLLLMGFARRHLRSFVLVWLVFQAATLSALVPSGCCPAHERAERKDTDCHGTGEDLCPMKSATGEECPMHAARASATPESAQADCILMAPCHAPATALALLLPVAGVLTDSADLTDAGVARLAPPVAPRVLIVTVPFDTPPPRSVA